MIEADLARLRKFIDDAAERGVERLPPEPKLSDALGVSRGRLRTLLKRMEDDGVIWRHVGKGTFIGHRQASHDHSIYADAISVDDIMEARLLLEPQMAAQAAIRATPSDMQTLVHCLEEMKEAESFSKWKRLDEKLHRTIAQATHNALLLLLYDALRSPKLSLDRRLEEIFGASERPKTTTDEHHAALVEAICSHNPPRAEDTMRQHLQSVRQRIFGVC